MSQLDETGLPAEGEPLDDEAAPPAADVDAGAAAATDATGDAASAGGAAEDIEDQAAAQAQPAAEDAAPACTTLSVLGWQAPAPAWAGTGRSGGA